MTYPAPPDDVAPNRVRPDPGQFWSGAVATAVVAALIALVGILICRWTLNIPILAPAGEGAWGNAHTGEYVLLSGLAALVAAGVLYLLMLSTPQPTLFFGWIMGLVTLIAVVYPFSSGAPLDQKAATAVVNLILGIAIASLLMGVAARAIRIRRRVPPPSYPSGYGPGQSYVMPDQGYVRPDQGNVRPGQGYVRPDEGHASGQQFDSEPTQPLNAPQRRWTDQ